MHKGVFPDIPEDWNDSEEAWEDYCALVWCCNSLNAVMGRLRHAGQLKPMENYLIADYLERAQAVISFYVNERRKDDPNKTV